MASKFVGRDRRVKRHARADLHSRFRFGLHPDPEHFGDAPGLCYAATRKNGARASKTSLIEPMHAECR